MISSLKPVLDILGMPQAQFMVPVFQRVYSWDRVQCRQIWKDVIHAGADGKDHFAGTLIYREEGPEEAPAEHGANAQALSRFSIIDGQQRLTTTMLLIAALRDKLRSMGETQRADELDQRYLHAAPREMKLVLSSEDAGTLEHIIDKKALPPDVEPSKLLVENHKLFAESLASSDADIEAAMQGLSRLKVVAVELGDCDSPQQVFESLNTKGRPLSTVDLLRNMLISEYGYDEQERLLDAYWAPIEEAFGQFGKEKDLYLDAALHCWMAKTSPGLRASKRSGLYQAFKAYFEHRSAQSLEAALSSINAECLRFASDPSSPEAKAHIDWAIEKPTGSMRQKRLFGD